MAVNEHIRKDANNLSIDDIIQHLSESSLLPKPATPSEPLPARLLVFAILGWQTMLYLPSFGSCSLSELAIHQDADQPNSKLVFDTYKVSVDLADRPLAIFLKGFGNLLPARSQVLTKLASETSRVASS